MKWEFSYDEVRVTKDERRKPDIYKLYDHTKGDIDVVDLISTSYTTRIKNKRWPINAFAFILDTVWTNVKTILQESTAKLKVSNFEVTYNLGKLLVLPQIERRYANPNGLQIDLMQHIWRALGISEVNCCVVTSTLPLPKLGRIMLVLRIWLVQMCMKKDVRN